MTNNSTISPSFVAAEDARQIERIHEAIEMMSQFKWEVSPATQSYLYLVKQGNNLIYVGALHHCNEISTKHNNAINALVEQHIRGTK